MRFLELLRGRDFNLPLLAKFAIVMAIILCVPRLCRRARLPVVVGMLLAGIAVGPFGLDVFAEHAPTVDFLAGLAVNATVRSQPAKEKLEFLGNVLFIPVFFLVTGFLINPAVFARTIADRLPLAAYQTLNPAYQRLIDRPTLNVILVLVLATSVLGPILVDRITPRLAAEAHPDHPTQ